MQKEIGYSKIENPEIGTINQWKLAEEFAKAGISILDFAMFEGGRLVITLDEKDLLAIDAVLADHDPTPEPEPLTLEEQVAVLDGAMNELLFEILPSLQGGEI